MLVGPVKVDNLFRYRKRLLRCEWHSLSIKEEFNNNSKVLQNLFKVCLL